jgi:D-galactarolactone cycloisomerase
MKITSVKTHLLRHRLPRAYGVSTYLYDVRESVLVQITTDEGLVGWGETAHLAGVRGLIEEQLAAQLIGKDPLQHRRLWRELWGPNFGNGLAVGAVDTALHDVRGKALNLSIADQYGGRLRDRVPVYASAMNYVDGMDPLKQYPEEAAGLVQRGFQALKMRIGRFSQRRDLATVAAVREAVGPDIRLMADANGAYTVSETIQMGKELEKLGLYWFEEPLPQEHYIGYEVITDKLDIAIAAGEALASRGAFQEVLTRRAMDIVQPDISLCGGIAECLFVCELARLFGIQAAPHCWGGAITIAATVQLLALLPDASWAHTTYTPMLELDCYENPFRDQVVKQPVQVREGYVEVPTGPGLGIEIDEEVVRRYEVT